MNMDYYLGQNVHRNERVVTIMGNSSNWYEQAVFIIKKDAGKKEPVDFVKEAEAIIDSYMQKLAAGNGAIEQMTFEDSFENISGKPICLAKQNRLTMPRQNKKKSGIGWVSNLALLVACVAIFVMVLLRVV